MVVAVGCSDTNFDSAGRATTTPHKKLTQS